MKGSQNVTAKERYHYRKDNGICVQCGKPLDKESKGKARCSACRKLNAEHRIKRYTDFRAEHRCLSCGKQLDKDYTCVRCGMCAKKVKEYKKIWWQKQKKNIFEKFRKVRK